MTSTHPAEVKPLVQSEPETTDEVGPQVPPAHFDAARTVVSPAARTRPSRPVGDPGILHSVQSLLYIIVVALFIITFTAQPFRIPSESMEPTLLVGDFLLVDKEIDVAPVPGGLIPAGRIRRGDLIVFHYPVTPSLHLVKRVIGLPGDHLRLRNGRAFVNGQPLAEPYAVFTASGPDFYRDEFPQMSSADPSVESPWWIQMRTLVAHGELTVPADSYFVLGDNRNNSEDSRYWGLVPRQAIVGKPFLVYFSLRDPRAASVTGAAQASESGHAVHSGATTPGGSHAGGLLGYVLNVARWDRSLRVVR